jgi:carboxylesterase
MAVVRDTAVLMLHGFTAQPKTVDFIERYFQREGYEYEIPVLRGHATKREDLVGVRWQDWVEDALNAYSRLKEKKGKVAVVGHSMGAVAAIQLAVQKPDVAAVVLVAPALKFSNPMAGIAPLLKNFVKWNPGSGSSVIDPKLREESDRIAVTYKGFPTAAFAELFNMAKLTVPKLELVRCPALVIHSLKDQVIPPAAGELALEKLGSVDKSIKWLQNSGHEMFWDMEREALCEMILGFLNEKT